ncbi:hypothetical protein Sulac_1220 [Sulfobacillus acidophilus DSM 10332]|uniref:Uncharacterized protein n=1 Tax=Sulfobacillus acidophilus (strain ATCC 700253 / DSM 10332 / NAL) TaxID=679936 RepID=G8TV80_SULAD|nr:hypothetical protein Sulac_1220 [Sulfobacillus acidophilus DSM 10332]
MPRNPKPIHIGTSLAWRSILQWGALGGIGLAGIGGALWYGTHVPASRAGKPIVLKTPTPSALQQTPPSGTSPASPPVSQSSPSGVPRSSPPSTHPPTPPVSTPPQSSLWASMATIDTHYLTQLVALQHQALPWLTASVANDATVGLNDFNNPIVLNQYHVPPLPPSLAAAGVNPATLPANNSIEGLSSSRVALWQAEADHGPTVAHLSAAQLTTAVNTATQFLLADDGNGCSAVYLQNPFAAWVSGSRTYALTSPAISVGGLTGPQGLFAQRQYVYQAWANVSAATIGFSTPDPQPAGHVVTTVLINNIQVNLVMGGIDQGHEIIGIYPAPPTNVAVDLIQDNGQTRWYVSWASSGETGNPSRVLWTGPAVS